MLLKRLCICYVMYIYNIYYYVVTYIYSICNIIFYLSSEIIIIDNDKIRHPPHFPVILIEKYSTALLFIKYFTIDHDRHIIYSFVFISHLKIRILIVIRTDRVDSHSLNRELPDFKDGYAINYVYVTRNHAFN